MPTPTTRTPEVSENDVLRAMFAARKEVFVDLLKWDLPVLDGRFEIDQFDTPAAHYLILADEWGRHRASARLLPTDSSHLLGDLYPFLCDGPVPAGPNVREITRFCLDRNQTAGERRMARRSEEHTSELQSLMRISYAVFRLTKNTTQHIVYLLKHTIH